MEAGSLFKLFKCLHVSPYRKVVSNSADTCWSCESTCWQWGELLESWYKAGFKKFHGHLQKSFNTHTHCLHRCKHLTYKAPLSLCSMCRTCAPFMVELPLVWHRRAPFKARLAAVWTAEAVLTVLPLWLELISRDISLMARKARTAMPRHQRGQRDSGRPAVVRSGSSWVTCKLSGLSSSAHLDFSSGGTFKVCVCACVRGF